MTDFRPPKRYKATAKEWETIRESFKNERCWVCDEPWNELHHILNRAHSGDDVSVNLAPLCAPCHARVEARDPHARAAIRASLMPSNLAYLRWRLEGNLEGWLDRNYAMPVAA